jgi:hypothetical protein
MALNALRLSLELREVAAMRAQYEKMRDDPSSKKSRRFPAAAPEP